MDKCEKKVGKAIEKINLEVFNPEKYFNYEPALLVYGKEVYRLSAWKELLKVFYFLCNKSSQKAKDLFDLYRDKFLAQSDGKCRSRAWKKDTCLTNCNGRAAFMRRRSYSFFIRAYASENWRL